MRALKMLFWAMVGLAGAAATGLVACQRGEPINALWLVIAAFCTAAILLGSLRSWWQLLRGARSLELKEEPVVSQPFAE